MNSDQSLLSIILLAYNSGEKLVKARDKIDALLNENSIPYEIIIMDDGSHDNSVEIAKALEKKHVNVHAYQLSKNYTSHYSIFAGLSKSKGRCAMPMVDDEQQPYESIVDMYRLWQKGHKIIIPHRRARQDAWYNTVFSNGFYKLMNAISEVQYPPGGADLFFVDREVIDIINLRIRPIHTSSIAEVLRLGFDPCFYAYDRPKGTNEKSRWSFKKKIRLAADTFFSSSSFPIKLITRLGLVVSMISFLLIGFYTYIKVFGNSEFWGLDVPGWTSIILAICMFSGLILLSLGVIADYVWRIYEEVKGRPGYIIRDK